MAKYGPKPRPAEERFWEKVQKTDTCWLWTGCVNGVAGYGMFMLISPNKEPAHRVSWVLHEGAVPQNSLGSL